MAFSRNRDPIQKLVGAAIAIYMTGLCVWAVCYALLGKNALGVWEVPSNVKIFGWTLLAIGLTMTVTAQAQMGISWRMGVDPEPTAIVKSGLFKFSRNPIYSGMLLTLFSYLFTSPCPWLLMGCCQFSLLIYLQTLYEEQALIKIHGDSYLIYASSVGRFFPKMGYLKSPTLPNSDDSLETAIVNS
ncbi:isoprenylcysteine carboxylmethyltransferase family protein [Pseudanabaena sp. FACHB-1998]|uniref:methyltransferase family protein n=1 Tax=Pseudanabaena sp. FACHB-1998 TaxID=2692858 RepID=UPI0016807000|nr:isoprenylcysteine carboxylmethyltransferase family protein [Pseudanabaena sp. FACHB-1998]MBD2177693.1 isoprenylcysteine carboxylmethyltransferase family protein [Pseudanabaena sp. FACHB-1998]